jgi:inosine triphosphate pyrophosphatase
MSVTFVTGNAHKARILEDYLGFPVSHHSVDIHEIQSLDLKEIARHKARLAYEQLKKPVLVEDVSLTINYLGKLPGPYIKWFIEQLGLEKICRLADNDKARKATARCTYAYYDGENFKFFEGSLNGTIADHPRSNSNFGWNPTFIPAGAELTLGEMDDETFKKYYVQIKPIKQVAEFLSGIDNNS